MQLDDIGKMNFLTAYTRSRGPLQSTNRAFLAHTKVNMRFGIHYLVTAAAGAIALASSAITAMAADAAFGPGNPFYAPSTLPFQAPAFDKIHDSDYQPAIKAGMAEQIKEIRAIADNPDQRNQPASQLALTSLKVAFQCVEPSPPPTARPTASKAQSGKAKGPVVLTPIH